MGQGNVIRTVGKALKDAFTRRSKAPKQGDASAAMHEELTAEEEKQEPQRKKLKTASHTRGGCGPVVLDGQRRAWTVNELRIALLQSQKGKNPGSLLHIHTGLGRFNLSAIGGAQLRKAIVRRMIPIMHSQRGQV